MRAVLLTLTTCLFVLPANAKYSGGTGEPNDPYQIATAADLIALGETPDDYDKHFILTADIDLDPNVPGRKVFDKAVIAPTKNFAGVFDGQGHTISHLTIQGKGYYLGLFGLLAYGAEVRDVGVVDVSVTGSGSYVAGLVGLNSGTLTHCLSTGAVSGDSFVGGLVGSNDSASTVTQCYSTCVVKGMNYVGGLVGQHVGSVTDSFSTGAVSGDSSVGGLVGLGRWYSLGGPRVDGSVVRCYSTGAVSGGGLVGDGGAVVGCFWDTQTSGQTASAGGTGKTTTEMQMASTFLSAGWDFAGEIENGTSQVWQVPEGGGYPMLAKFSGYTPPQLEGLGTPDVPYLITDASELGAIFYYSRRAHYRLATSVDLSGIRWGAAVIPSFGGTFDGNGHTISHLTIKSAGYLGLFGQLASGAQVKNVGVVDVNLVSVDGRAGGLVGGNGGIVTQCYSTGRVEGGDAIGGLVGSNRGGRICTSQSTAVVIGNLDDGGDVGGLVGSNDGDVIRCHSTGAVSGSGWGWGSSGVGGLIGGNLGTVNQSYSTSVVSSRVSAAVGIGQSGYSAVGGLMGYNGGIVTQCYSSGAVSGTRQEALVGGLVGYNDEGTVTECYSTGAVSGSAFTNAVGGLVGLDWSGTMTECYSTGAVSGRGFGGLVGEIGSSAKSSMIGCFWDTETSGQTKSAGGTGKRTAAMQRANTFLYVGWDFVGETTTGTEDIWWIVDGSDYPRLWWESGSALAPDPEEGASEVIWTPILRWKAGGWDYQHDVYFGEDREAIANATRETAGVYRGRQPAGVTIYDPGILKRDRTYYWRIDEVSEGNPADIWKGDVWTFATIDAILVVDDFEGYSEDYRAGKILFQTWNSGLVDGRTGSAAGPFTEQEIVHSGRQSMPMDYDNMRTPFYSQADRTWRTPQDWTIEGADTLTLYFRGEPNNNPEPLYVGIEDSAGRIAVAVHPDTDAVLASEWQKWHIALADVQAAGVDVAAVQKMVMGVGDRKNPKPGGTGRIYVDDIRLTKRMP